MHNPASRISARRPALRRLGLALAAALAVTLGLAGCDTRDEVPFSIVAGSENTVIEPIVKEFCDRERVKCSFRYEGSLDIGLALQQGNLNDDAVWPASSVWIDLFDSARSVRSLTSIAQTPVILGLRKSKAEELGWNGGRQVFMRDILAAVRQGRLKFLMTSATQSNSGASAYLSMLASALGDRPVIAPDDLDNEQVRETVSGLLQGVERSSGSSGWLADLYLQQARQGVLYDGMWNYEAVLKETNDTLKTLGREPLYAIYPADGVAVADSPLGFIDRGRGERVEKFFRDLLAYLQTEPVQRRIAATGRRIPLAEVAAPAEADWNFDPTRLVTAIRMPEPSVIRHALNLYQEALRKPSFTALCLDFSGSMRGKGREQLIEAMRFLFSPERAREVLVQWSPQDRIVVIPFDSDVRDLAEGNGEPQAQSALLRRVEAERASGGTDMYACAATALQRIAATPDIGRYLPAIVLMTDGRSSGLVEPFLREWRAAPIQVPVFGITFGDADAEQLRGIAGVTSARVFDGGKDLAGAFRAARGYN